ncbi:MAG: fluoride exporter [Gaiellaceae bacterium]|jgi:CrcB protein|nr:fluoride exporter [Gaiellaceae bacterium]
MGLAFNRRERLMAPTDERSLAMLVALAVAVGGALGALARYGLDRFVQHHVLTVFPWSTFTINVTGCLLVGVLIGALVDRHHTPEWLRIGTVLGFLGAYTTFSTFAQETLDLAEGPHLSVAFVYSVGSVALGVAAVALGLGLGRTL